MSAFAVSTIRSACLAARASGLRIVRGPFFDWTGGDGRLVAVDGLGAVLWAVCVPRAPSRVTALRELLDVDGGWLARWSMGWDRDVVLVMHDDKWREIGRDAVSLAGQTLARELVDR